MLLVDTTIHPSPIHGIGLFADEFIPNGKEIWQFLVGFDLKVRKDAIRHLAEPAKKQFLKYSYLELDNRHYVLCFDDARFFNHSDTPNTDSRVIDTRDVTVATRDIAAEEEITCDYRSFDLEWPKKLPPDASPVSSEHS